MTLMPEEITHRLGRRFTTAGSSPYDDVAWELRDARLTDHRDGSIAFEQVGVEFPADWSVTASNIVAQKYFRGQLGTSRRERSLRQVIDRVVDTIASWGTRDGYFADDGEADTFAQELRWLLLHQRVSFNSPVWFNIGVAGVAQQAAACFILDVEDDLRSILNWYEEEGVIFKGGSGAGANLSKIRSSRELLSGGGSPSGPVSFMRGADASAGTIKSGGTTRRAAKMVILDVDHPDVEEFIWCKAREERKARVLKEAGFDMDLDGADSFSVQYQNANNSVRLTDDFMQAALDGRDWELTARTSGEVVDRVPARRILREIAEASWECADPGVQFDTTINRWNTTPNAGRIEASNPCFTGDTLVHTDRGLVAFTELVDRLNHGEELAVYTHDATHPDHPAERVRLSSPDAVMVTGHHPVLRLRFANGMEVRATPNHRFFTRNRGFVRADELGPEDQVRVLDQPAPAMRASFTIPVHAGEEVWREKYDRREGPNLPEEWDHTFAHWLGWLIGDGCISGNTVTTIYGTAEERDTILPLHQMLVRGDRRSGPQDDRATQRHHRAAHQPRSFPTLPGGPRGQGGQGPRQVRSMGRRAGPPGDRCVVPAGTLRRRRLRHPEPGQGQLRRPGLRLAGAPARCAAPAEHLRHREPYLPHPHGGSEQRASSTRPCRASTVATSPAPTCTTSASRVPAWSRSPTSSASRCPTSRRRSPRSSLPGPRGPTGRRPGPPWRTAWRTASS